MMRPRNGASRLVRMEMNVFVSVVAMGMYVKMPAF